jgi:hypothetical protein
MLRYVRKKTHLRIFFKIENTNSFQKTPFKLLIYKVLIMDTLHF